MVDEARIRNIMASVLGVDSSSIGDDTSMDTVPNWDSMRQMNLVLALEKAFDVSFPDEDAFNATSFKLVSLVLQEQLGGT
jgi:acyl carrier protein